MCVKDEKQEVEHIKNKEQPLVMLIAHSNFPVSFLFIPNWCWKNVSLQGIFSSREL